MCMDLPMRPYPNKAIFKGENGCVILRTCFNELIFQIELTRVTLIFVRVETKIMNTQINLTVEKRDNFGTGAARACRNDGKVPGIVYGAKKDTQGVAIDPKMLMAEIYKPNFFATIYSLDIEGQKEQIIVKDVQIHPVTDYPMHVDFLRIVKGSKVTVSVPVNFINEDKAAVLKRGGVLNIVRHALKITAPVESVPEFFTVDLAIVDLSKGVHLDMLDMPKGVVAAHPKRDYTLATLVTKRMKEEGEEEAKD